MMKKRVIAAVLALPMASGSIVHAQEVSDAPSVKISGFGTGALTWTNTDRAEFSRPNQASGARKNPTTGVDSNLGLQMDVGLNQWLSFTGQGLVRKDAEEGFGAELTWAFAKAKINDHFSARIGRTAVPAFMISDYRNVGYANSFLRAPVEMYSQVPYNSLDGIDLTYRQSFGDTSVTALMAYGRSEVKVAGGVTSKAKNLTALNVTAEHGPFTARFGRVDGKISVTGSPTLLGLVNGLRAAGTGYGFPQLNTFAEQLDPTEKKSSFTSVGLGVDWSNFVGQAEFAKRKSKSYVNNTTSWYVMGGYRFGKVLPYVMHSKLSIDSFPVNTVPSTCPPGYPAACSPTMAALRAGAARVPYSGLGQGAQSTTSIGVRWDFHSSLALKAQVDRVKPAIGSGLLLNAEPGFTSDVTVGAVALDFVF